MNSKYALVGILASVALLSGCATNAPTNLTDADYVYKKDESRARNIANFFGFEKIRDAKAPEGFKGDGSVLWNSTVWAGNLDAAANIGGALPGVSGWGAVGLGLGLGIAQSMLTPDAQEEIDILPQVNQGDSWIKQRMPSVDGLTPSLRNG